MRISTHVHLGDGEAFRARRIHRDGSHWLEVGGDVGDLTLPIFCDSDQVVPLILALAATLNPAESLELSEALTATDDGALVEVSS